MTTITHINPDTGLDHTTCVTGPDAHFDVDYDGIKWVDVKIRVNPTDDWPDAQEASITIALDLDLIPDLIARLQTEMDRGLEYRAYKRYQRECDREELEPLTRHMWNVHGRPEGPLG